MPPKATFPSTRATPPKSEKNDFRVSLECEALALKAVIPATQSRRSTCSSQRRRWRAEARRNILFPEGLPLLGAEEPSHGHSGVAAGFGP